jgi:hypothetical protein
MNLAQVLKELPTFTSAERQLLVHRAMELDNPSLSKKDEKLIAPAAEAKLTLEESFAAMANDTSALKEAREWAKTGLTDGLEEDSGF